jgi:hypothetical protein
MHVPVSQTGHNRTQACAPICSLAFDMDKRRAVGSVRSLWAKPAQRSLAQVDAPTSCSHRRVLYCSFCCACTARSSAENMIILLTGRKDFQARLDKEHTSLQRENFERNLLVELPTFSSNSRSSSPTFLAWSSCSPRCFSSHRTAS